MIQCRLCGKQGHEAGLLQRVNPLGENGIFECRPSCERSLPLDEALVSAIEGTYENADKVPNGLQSDSRDNRQ